MLFLFSLTQYQFLVGFIILMKTFKQIPASRPITPLLDQIQGPASLQALSLQQLPQLADQLREYLL